MAIGPMSEAERYRFDLHGFLVRRDVLGAGDVAALHAAIDVLDLPRPGRTSAASASTTTCPIARRFRDLIDHAAVLEIVRETCGPQRPPRPRLRDRHVAGHERPRPARRRRRRSTPPQYYLVDGGRIRTGLVAAQWALVDHPPGAGGFVCIPGSHKAGFALPPTFDRDLAVAGAARRRRRHRVQRGVDPRHAAVAVARGAAHPRLQVLARATRRGRRPAGRRTPGRVHRSPASLLQPPSVGHHRPVAP